MLQPKEQNLGEFPSFPPRLRSFVGLWRAGRPPYNALIRTPGRNGFVVIPEEQGLRRRAWGDPG